MQKVSITSDATLWAELAKCRHKNFCSPFLRVASVESTRIYEKLVAKKVKDTPPPSVWRIGRESDYSEQAALVSLNCYSDKCRKIVNQTTNYFQIYRLSISSAILPDMFM